MNIVQKAINYTQAITADTIMNAKSGHLGTSLGGATILFSLFKDHYNFDISDTDFLNRDRLVVSAGHASAVYYTLLSMFGFDVSLQDLKEFRKFDSKTPGHPEYRTTDGVETTTGALGQGVANAVGMAIASQSLADRFNTVGFPIISNYTYCYCGDGDLMEGVAQEACSLAGTLKLSKLILLYDCNDVSMDGPLSLSNRENVAKKFSAMGWNVIQVRRGNKYSSCTRAIDFAKKSKRPTLIIFKTTIGIGTNRQGTSAAHGYIMTQEELEEYKQKLCVKDSFFIPGDVRELCMASARRGKLRHEEWNQTLAIYANSQPELYKEFVAYFDKKKLDFDKLLKNPEKWQNLSTRDANNILFNEIAGKLTQIIGGTADVGRSTRATISSSGNFMMGTKRGRNVHFGVREHAMAAICNGIALYEDFIAYDSTFLAFSDYMMPALRMRAMMKLPVISIFTHDSIHVGEDGPSHQPTGQLAGLRSIIGLNVFRPCDGNEILAGYKTALSNREPLALILSRQELKAVANSSFKDAQNGGYILLPANKEAEVVLYASGSEVPLAMEVAKDLSKKLDVSVVSMPCLEVFEKQTTAYKTRVLQKNAKLKVAIEASNDTTWYKYLGENDMFVCLNNYMKSGDGETNYIKAGFSSKAIVRDILAKINKK